MLAATLTVTLPNGEEIEVPVSRHRRRRHLALVMTADGPQLRLPLRAALAQGEKFIQDNSAWLQQRLVAPRPQPTTYTDGSRLLWLGEELELKVRQGSKWAISKHANELHATVLDTQPKNLERLVKYWGKQEAAKFLAPRVQYWAKKINVVPSKVSVGNSKSNWGSCSSKGRLRFTWYLLKAPPPVIDSVVIHELCHLVELNHSPKFWELVKQYDANLAESNAWFKQHGPSLLQ